MGPSMPGSPTGNKCLVKKGVFMGGLGQEDPWLPPWGRQWSHQPGVCIPMPCVNQLWETNSIDRDAYPCCLSVLLVLLVLGAHLDQECLERKTQQMFKALVCVPWKNNMQIRGTWSLEGFISSGKEYITWKVGTWTGISLEEHNTCKSTRKLPSTHAAVGLFQR